jgi:hypothetical protein
MNKWLEILLGLILVIGMILLGYYSSVQGWTVLGKSLNLLSAGWIVFKGAVFWGVIMIGFLFLLLGLSDLRE